MRPGDLLVSWSATLGAFIWDGPEAVLNQHIFKVKSSMIDQRLHFHLIRECLAELYQNAHGSGMVHVTKGMFDRLPVNIPADRAMQSALAAILDTVDEKQLSSLRHLTNAKRALGRLRQAILVAATTGRLTADWRDARSALSAGPEPDETLPPTWRWSTLGQIGTVRVGGTPSRQEPMYWLNGTIPWVSSGEVANCRLSTTRERITKRGLEESNAKLYPVGSVLIAMIGEGKTRGQSAILDVEACTNQNVAAVLPNAELIDPEYLWRWALGQYEITRAAGRGGNQPALNGQKVRELDIPVPPLEEQQEIIRRVDGLLMKADSLTERLANANDLIDGLTKIALTKAFRGELFAMSEAE